MRGLINEKAGFCDSWFNLVGVVLPFGSVEAWWPTVLSVVLCRVCLFDCSRRIESLVKERRTK